MQDNSYWLNRWTQALTGWHQSEVEPSLIRYFSALPKGRVLVPLCGKSMDLAWLAAQGHAVVGVELSEMACEAFFREQGLPYEIATTEAFRIYRSQRIEIFQGDFFALAPRLLGEITAVYDRAALIALPRELRERYARHLQTIAKPREALVIAIARDGSIGTHPEVGPPYTVTPEELELLYGERYRIEVLEREAGVPLGSSNETLVTESVYRLTPLS